MLAKIISAVTSLFKKNSFGVILKIMLAKAATSVMKEILDKENQKKAIEFVKELNANDKLTNSEKADVFNARMAEWARKLGKKIAESALNCLREMAVSAVKAEKETEEEKK